MRVYKNVPEGKLFEMLSQLGFQPRKRGYPDFWFVNDSGELCLVEVKQKAVDRLKREQRLFLEIASKYGIKCFRYAPDSGLVEFRGDR